MRGLITRVQDEVLCKVDSEKLCTGTCIGCPKKLLEYLSFEAESWEHRLNDGDVPNFGEVKSFAKTSSKIYRALELNGLIATNSLKKTD